MKRLWNCVLLLLAMAALMMLVLPWLPPRPNARTIALAQRIRELGGTLSMPFARIISVRFEDTTIRDSDLRILQELPDLRVLDLENSGIGDAALEHVGEARALEYLYLDRTAVSDEGLRHLVGLKSLRDLSLDHTEITDGAIVHLGLLQGLEVVFLRDTRVTAKGISELQRLLPNTVLVHRPLTTEATDK